MSTATEGDAANGGILNKGVKEIKELDAVTIRFAGDSGDGMQLTGSQFTETSAILGNDLATFPDYPAEIRAPQGTVAGVSSYQLQFSSNDVRTPGDFVDVLVAMNAAALKKNTEDLRKGGILIVDKAGFGKNELKKAGYEENPLADHSLDGFRLVPIDITKQTLDAVKPSGVSGKDAERCKNMYTLGLVYWLYDRPLESTIDGLNAKFKKKKPEVAEANVLALKAGNSFAGTIEMFSEHYSVRRAPFEPGEYRNISGNAAAALGIVAAGVKAGKKIFFGGYPITPASDVLHELAKHKNFGVRTFQAEDEIAAVGSAIGASFGGELAVTCTSGPGLALKAEAINLAVMTELPLLIINVQRGGPSTGLPTKTEQSDLLQVLYGRNGDSPMPVISASTPGDCFETAYEAMRLAVKYMTPVVLLTDGYIANGTEPWKVPDVADLKGFTFGYGLDPEVYKPFLRNPETLARPWAVPGTPGLEHRLTGIEHDAETGLVSYDPDNHHQQTMERKAKIAGMIKDIPASKVRGAQKGDLLVISWGGTYGSVTTAVDETLKAGHKIGHVHLRYINPLPPDLKDIADGFKQVVVPEINAGQLGMYLTGMFYRPVLGYNRVRGKQFMVSELVTEFTRILKEGV